MSITLKRWTMVVAVAVVFAGCVDVSVDSEGLRTPTEFTAVQVEGNTLSLSEDGSKAVVWVNESLEQYPQWFNDQIQVIGLSSMSHERTYQKPFQYGGVISAACLSASGDSVWYSLGGRLFAAATDNSNSNQVSLFGGTILSLCYDPFRRFVYVYSGGSDQTSIHSHSDNSFPSDKELVTYNTSAWYRFGSQRMRMVGNDLIMTPNGRAVDLVSKQVIWILEGDVAMLSPTTLVTIYDRTPYLLDVSKEDPQGMLHPQDDIFYSYGAVGSKDGERFAVIYNTNSGMTTDSCYVAVFNAKNGEELYRIAPSQQGYGDQHTDITDVEFSPMDHTILYVIDKDGNLCRWRLP